MSAEIQLIEGPVKYALIATTVFIVSAYILGYAYKILALSSLGMPLSATWDSVEAIAGLTVGRSVRYFAFFFVSLLAFACYERSDLKSSPWGGFVLLGIFPVVMAFVPYVFSDQIHASSAWAITAALFSLLYLGVGHNHSSKMLRWLFFLLMAYLVIGNVLQNGLEWGGAINAETVKLYGEGGAANRRVKETFVWFVPAELVSVGVQLYLAYWLPQKFFSELRGNDSRGNGSAK